ncbi:universal stress protein [Mycolicibacterium moriokaense]|uniref:Universal stress protein n=1 Tax=Mycolicibacterium moriokaense TaxID=39691 RepID=A0AAD1M8D8_9MYCO|nr:universal stress protein [Mycolicibacterium moriokaense]MCV7040470.1 universal stress protein [Mycolicibacterium moriokaense]ORB15109.1 universal stress protein [Mycolicibacterium moriokaense]BBX03421.1 universal stress protein [Mycolicibacterium moriokaense]
MSPDEVGVVVAVDGSPSAEAALKWAAQAARLRDTRLTIVHVIAPVVGTWLATPVPADVLSWQNDLGQQILEEAVSMATDAADGTLHVSTELLRATATPALVEMSQHAQMVVVGSRGRGRLARALLGSVSMGLVHHARCPVAVIRAETPNLDGPVLLGADLSPSAEAATSLAFEEASRRGVELVALHAWWGSGAFEFDLDWENLRVEVDRQVAEQLSVWHDRYPEVAVRRVIVRDQPAVRLVDYPGPPQMIVVGSHGHGAIASTLLGSVSTAVVQAAQTPVIVART